MRKLWNCKLETTPVETGPVAFTKPV